MEAREREGTVRQLTLYIFCIPCFVLVTTMPRKWKLQSAERSMAVSSGGGLAGLHLRTRPGSSSSRRACPK